MSQNLLNTVEKLPVSKLLLVDCETHTTDARFDPTKAVYLVGIIQFTEANKAKVLKLSIERAVEFIDLRLSQGYTMVCHNAKYDYSVLKTHGLKHTIKPGELSVACTMQMAYFRDSNLDSFSLDYLTGQKDDVIEKCAEAGVFEGYEKLPSKADFWNTDWSDNKDVLKVIEDYCIQDLKATVVLYKRLASWYNCNPEYIPSLLLREFPAIEFLSQLERVGAYVCPTRLSDLSQDLNRQLTEARGQLTAEVYKLPKLSWKEDHYEPVTKTYSNGVYKNAGSKSPIVASYMDNDGRVTASNPYIIYDHCELTDYNSSAATGHNWWLLNRYCPDVLERANATKKGRPQLDKDYFKDIADDLPENITIAKILKLTKAIQKTEEIYANIKADGRLHTHFNQCQVRTGRLSSSNPNLANLQRSDDNPNSIGSRFRGLFAAPAGKRILVADLDRIEIVVLAWFLFKALKDSNLRDIVNSGLDVHQANADLWGVSRTIAKTLIFLLVYGGGAQKIFRNGMAPTLEAAQALVDQVNEKQPTIETLKQMCWQRWTKTGFVTNPFKCHVPYPELGSKRKWERAAGERKSFNCLIQRTARDVYFQLVIETLPVLDKHGASLVNSIYDEVVVECPEETAEACVRELNAVWQNRWDILKDIKVNGDWNAAEDWYHAK